MAKQVSVSLEPEHVRIIERFGKKTGIKSFSGSLQSIIHQFDQQQKAAEAATQSRTDQTAPQAA